MTHADTPKLIVNQKALKEFYLNSVFLDGRKLQILFPLKCHNLFNSLKLIRNYSDGFAVSSLHEARLANELMKSDTKIHFTSPGLRHNELDNIIKLCHAISFNSLNQWNLNKQKAIGKIECALRVNPQLSYVSDRRYDPCRKHSRLGIPLDQIKVHLQNEPEMFNGIEGIHFHTNCDSEDLTPLLLTVMKLDSQIPGILQQCKWINLGGGYLFSENTNCKPLEEAVKLLQNKYSLEVIIEPGASVVRDACYLVSSVVDIINSDGKDIAVLDTTVNHMPEVFEYQYRPDILNEDEDGKHTYILEGSTCLAGDHFGEYSFKEPLEIGSQIIFTGMGAYTMVKAHMFNGINLPSVYALTEKGELVLQKEYTYEDFRNRCGATDKNEIIRNTLSFEDNPSKRRIA